jgi:(1->4)-alpha-D-glucan 1-alpha-D-glucosylmutase
MRAEEEEVFRDMHVLVARLARRPGVDGVRIDHPDGLADPRQYLERVGGLFERAPWVLVEKIRAEHEELRRDWPVHGTTGYRFANVLTGVFIDAAAEPRFDRIYRRFTGEQRSFEEIGRESRYLIMATTLAGDLSLLASRLARIAEGNRRTRDYTESGLRKALAEVAACFPVYRTYVSARGVSDLDRRYIDWAVSAARRASRIADPAIFDFVRSVLTLEAAPESGPRREEMLRFVLRFQQFTAPVVAKGVEDTAFYRYSRLIALNEVGGEPARFGLSLKAFHAAAEDRMRRWPWTMLGTSTHDTKRSEDARARLGVLSEVASAWRLALRRWSVLNRSKRTEAGGASLPSRGDEYHFYQALVAIWPGESMESLRERLVAYMLKAVREAKQYTSWINPDQQYEQALERFVAESLGNELFLRDVREVMPGLERLGRLVSLSQALLKVASPGVPDYYQGTELMDFSLVDPDNRRPVDYRLRKALLASGGDDKLRIIQKGLEVRRKLPHLFHDGRYTPLYADAGMEEKVIAFALERGADRVIAVAPRLFASLADDNNRWGRSRLALPEGRYEEVLTGRTLRGGPTPVAEILSGFAVALLVSRV